MEGKDTSNERLLSMQDIADRYGVPVATVRGWRTKNYGPKGLSIGKYVRYRLTECIAWEEAQLAKVNTAA
jgi:predicted DNA-binding transcriptional regulator AlpA